MIAAVEEIIGRHGHHWLRDRYEHYNSQYVKPLFMRDAPKTRNARILHVYTERSMKEAMDQLEKCGTIQNLPKFSSVSNMLRQQSGVSLA